MSMISLALAAAAYSPAPASKTSVLVEDFCTRLHHPRPCDCAVCVMHGPAVLSDAPRPTRSLAAAPKHTWTAMNDPVMGGQSFSAVAVENGVLNFTGACKIVPSLNAPGFITAVSSDSNAWADVSTCEGLTITAKANSSYAGYRISFGHAHPIFGKFFASESPAAPLRSAFQPFLLFPPAPSLIDASKSAWRGRQMATRPISTRRNFTDFWDDATGNPIHTVRWWRRNVPAAVILTAAWLVCAQCSSNSRYCPDSKTLANMKTMSIWAEGVEGDINLQVKSVAGYGCTA
eukprot:6191012-Prymnesium_polylepis.1